MVKLEKLCNSPWCHRRWNFMVLYPESASRSLGHLRDRTQHTSFGHIMHRLYLLFLFKHLNRFECIGYGRCSIKIITSYIINFMTQILYNCFGKTHRQDSRGVKSGLFGNHNDISRLRTIAGDNLVQRSFQEHRPPTGNRRVLAWYLSGMPPVIATPASSQNW